jgi:uncharacterized membrane protein YqiK
MIGPIILGVSVIIALVYIMIRFYIKERDDEIKEEKDSLARIKLYREEYERNEQVKALKYINE